MEKDINEILTVEDAEWERPIKLQKQPDLDSKIMSRGSRYLLWTSRQVMRNVMRTHEKL